MSLHAGFVTWRPNYHHHSISKEPVFWNGITAVRLAPFSQGGGTLLLAN